MVMQFEYPRNALLDLSPINDAIDFRAKQQQRAKDNAYRDEQLGMQRDEYKAKARERAVRNAAGIAQMALEEKDPAKGAAVMNRLIASDPRWGDAIKENNLDPADWQTFARTLVAEARGPFDPLDQKLKQSQLATQDLQRQKTQFDMDQARTNAPYEIDKTRAQIDLTKAQANLANANAANRESPDQAFRVREEQARRLGLQPNDPAYRSYILTGKMPREDQQPLSASDKKAVLDAEDTVLATQNVITLLNEAEKLNSKANTGFGASTRASVGNMLPDWMVPDFVSSPESSRATANYENIVLGQALAQLKSTFGAAPTEGERKILIELQGSVSQRPEVRADILRRARALAEKRMQDNSSRAEAIRGQTYFKPGGAAGQPQVAPRASGGDVLNEARSAIARGVPRDAVIERLRQNGIDPSGL